MKTDPRITRLVAHLDATRAALDAELDAMPAAAWEARVAADTWTVAQIVEHLALVETGVTRLLTTLLPRAVEREADDVVSDTFVADLALSLLLDRSRRVEAAPPARPQDDATATRARPALRETRRLLLDTLRAGAGRELERLHYTHHFLGRLDLYQWIAFIGYHEARHTAQIRDVVRQLSAV